MKRIGKFVQQNPGMTVGGGIATLLIGGQAVQTTRATTPAELKAALEKQRTAIHAEMTAAMAKEKAEREEAMQRLKQKILGAISGSVTKMLFLLLLPALLIGCSSPERLINNLSPDELHVTYTDGQMKAIADVAALHCLTFQDQDFQSLSIGFTWHLGLLVPEEDPKAKLLERLVKALEAK